MIKIKTCFLKNMVKEYFKVCYKLRKYLYYMIKYLHQDVYLLKLHNSILRNQTI